MISSLEIEDFDNPDLFHDLALGYLDGSIVLTKEMIGGSFPDKFSHSRVILSLAYHAVELFFKGAILRKTGNKEVGGHVVKELHMKYNRLYPTHEFALDIPFGMEYGGYNTNQVQSLIKEEPPFDQTFRYHTNMAGEKWKGFRKNEGVHAFLPQLFLENLHGLRQRITDLGHQIHCKKQTE